MINRKILDKKYDYSHALISSLKESDEDNYNKNTIFISLQKRDEIKLNNPDEFLFQKNDTCFTIISYFFA